MSGFASPCPRPALVSVVSRAELAHLPEGPTRGHAHLGTDDYPWDGPGRLDYPPLLMVAEGRMRPGEGFPMHRHEGIENLLVVLGGQIRHRDESATSWVAGPGDACLMSSGRGGEHSEFVHGGDEVHALVIWLRSNRPEDACRFHRRHVGHDARRDRWVCLASPEPRDEPMAMPLQADATVLASRLSPGASLTHVVEPGRRFYLIAVDGGIEVNGQGVGPGERVLAPEPGEIECFARQAAGDVEIVALDMAIPT